MSEPRKSKLPNSAVYLLTAAVWGVILAASVWTDFFVRTGHLSPWRRAWDFFLTPLLVFLNLYLYLKRRAAEKTAA